MNLMSMNIATTLQLLWNVTLRFCMHMQKQNQTLVPTNIHKVKSSYCSGSCYYYVHRRKSKYVSDVYNYMNICTCTYCTS